MHIVTRFAPSPTGFMHIGGARTALYAFLLARKHAGTFILRIEDTDKEREVPGSVAHIQETLSWLGISWDFGPDKPGPFGSCVQSQRLDTYKKTALMLLDKGLAYPDPYTTSEVAKLREEAVREKRPFLFRDHRPSTVDTWDGSTALRFKVPEIKRYTWHDAVRGELTAGEESLDDFILMKADGYPTYNFAHIVDDHAMGVTHVLRADEFIASTPRFLSLYDALNIPYPTFVTLPPILRDDKTKKLGKRDGAKDVLEYRTDGYLPEALVNFLALIGWNPGTVQEVFTREELVAAFDVSGIQRAGAVFNEEKLRWMNREHLLRTPPEKIASSITERIHKLLPNVPADVVEKLLPTVRERISVFSDIDAMAHAGEWSYLEQEPLLDPQKLVWKEGTALETKAHLARVAELLSQAPESTFADSESVKRLVWEYAEQAGRGTVLWPTRYALTGKEKSPDPFTVTALLGKERTLHRLAAAQKLL